MQPQQEQAPGPRHDEQQQQPPANDRPAGTYYFGAGFYVARDGAEIVVGHDALDGPARITTNEWASTFAATTAAGDNSETFNAALNLLGQVDAGADVVPAAEPEPVDVAAGAKDQPHQFVLGDAGECAICGLFADDPVHNQQLRA